MRAVIRDEISKALVLPPGAQQTSYSTDYLRSLQARGVGGGGAARLPVNPLDQVPFGPGVPLVPSTIDQLQPSGRPAPRRFEYPVSWNLQVSTTRAVPWSVLRDSADQVSIMRSCIEVVKATLTGLEWSFGVDSSRAQHLAKRSGDSMHTVTADLQDKYADDIDRLHQFWEKPDRINNWSFSDWLGALMEDQLILDAVSAYPHLNFRGELHSLELIDPSTVKPLLDERGATPRPPFPAFQQILHGFPRGEFTQSMPDSVDREFMSSMYGLSDDGGAVPGDVLIYKVRNRRTRSPYGYSCVEQALTDVDLWLRRYEWLRTEYSAGVTPDMIVQVEANMTPEQLRQYEAVFNDDLSGQSAERRRARFLPAGFNPSYPNMADGKFTSDLDLHLIRLICAAFDVLPTSLGFTPNHGMGGMGGVGHQQAERDTQLYRVTKPTAQWIVDLINEVSQSYLGMPKALTFVFHGLDADDEQRDAELLTTYIQSGLQTLNEGRDQQNLPRYDFEEADQPMVVTPTGPVWLNVAAQPTAVPGNLPGAPQNQVPAVAEPASEPAAKPADDDGEDVKDAQGERAVEAKKFLSFAQKRVGRSWRDFQFDTFDADTAKAANLLASAGDLATAKVLLTEAA